MQNMITDNGDVIYYVLRANGITVSEKFSSQMLAEMQKQNLDPAIREVAQIVPVTSDGKELLLG